MISGSIVGAAKLMSVTQPGISRTIGMLEDRLGYARFQSYPIAASGTGLSGDRMR